jgi:hypothetical protein
MKCKTSILVLSLGLVMIALMATAHPGGSLIESRQGTTSKTTKTCKSPTILCNNQCVDSTTNTNCGTCGNKVRCIGLMSDAQGTRS